MHRCAPATRALAFDQTGFRRGHGASSASAPTPPGRAGRAKRPPVLHFRSCRRPSFEGYLRTESHDSEVLAIIDPQRPGRAAAQARRARRDRPGPHAVLCRSRRTGWRYRLALRQDHNTVVADVTGCYYPVQGVRAHKVTAKQAIRVGERVDPVVNTGMREQPCATTPPRTCSMRRCATFWAST